uniref:B-cell receptor CD22 n=1 Tax=Panagrellus redivivus TaxID=6233 RepID=A0A7E4ZSG2_PANRE
MLPHRDCPSTLPAQKRLRFQHPPDTSTTSPASIPRRRQLAASQIATLPVAMIWSNVRILPLLALIAITLGVASSEHAFATEPSVQPYYVRENEPGPILNCMFSETYRNRDRYEPEWTRVVAGTPKLLTRDSTVFLKNDYTLFEDAATGEYNLQIKIVNFERDNGQFFCSLLDRETGDQILSTPAKVMVVVPPSPPTITVQPSQPVKENDFVTIHCESSGGNPPPKFAWIFNNQSVVPESWYQDKSESAPRATSISVLQWRVNAADNGAYLTCQIWNDAMQKDEFRAVETNRLNVLFAPRVSVGPTSDYSVEEGEPVELTCEAEGNPVPNQFEWLHVSTGEHMTGKQWKFIADKKMRGDFRCTAVNSIDTGAAKLNVNVYYGPEITVPKVANPAEGDQLTLDCDVDANPPPEQIMWTGPGGFTHLGPKLTIDSINRDHTGNFTCQANNAFALFSTGDTVVQRTGASSTLVDVKRKPGAAIITASQTSVNVGDILTLSCTADDPGSPEAKYRWSTPATHGIFSQQLEFNRQTITVSKAALSDNGLYRCVAFNDIGQGDEAVMKIVVIEPARISRPLSESRVMTSGDVDASIDCEAVGYPQPNIRWTKNGLPVNEASNPHWVIQAHPTQTSCNDGEYCPWSVVSSLRFFETVEWSDKGNYTCIAENGNTGPLSQDSTILNVVHEPVILNEKFPTEALAAADVASVAKISCIVSARPEPKFVWMRDGSELDESDSRFSVHSSKLYNRFDEFESILEINDVAESDMGAYVCKAVNGQSGAKSAEVIINLQHKSKPQIPRGIQLHKASPTNIVVSWKPGFDGGDHQYFEIEYRIGNPWTNENSKSNPTTFILDENNATTIVTYENDQSTPRARRSPKMVSLLVHNLTLLTPMTVYWYRIRARNAYGYSDWSPIASAMTLDVTESVDIQPPTSLLYFANDQKIVFEPTRFNNDSCLLLYISGNDDSSSLSTTAGIWRALGCFPADQPVQHVEPAEHFKARFCQRNDLAVCSSSVEILVANSVMAKQWTLTIIIPIVIIVLLILLMLTLIIFCCKIRLTPARREKAKQKFTTVVGDPERAEVSGPIQPGDSKNTIHGSQTDSGVFTLGSLPNHAQQGNQAPSFENGFTGDSENGADSWHNSSDEHFNYNNDPYLQDYNNQFTTASPDFTQQPPPTNYQYFEGGTPFDKIDTVVPQGGISSGDENDAGSENGSASGGRVMREIIV